MEVAMTAVSAASSGGDVGTSRACAYVVSARNMMNATLASAIKNLNLESMFSLLEV